MANETMGIMFNAIGVMFNMVNCMPKGKGKRADEQYDDQRFNERVSGVEIHSYYYMGLSRVVGYQYVYSSPAECARNCLIDCNRKSSFSRFDFSSFWISTICSGVTCRFSFS
jgi:hypothetical protein